jgi:hypothetical protein
MICVLEIGDDWSPSRPRYGCAPSFGEYESFSQHRVKWHGVSAKNLSPWRRDEAGHSHSVAGVVSHGYDYRRVFQNFDSLPQKNRYLRSGESNHCYRLASQRIFQKPSRVNSKER